MRVPEQLEAAVKQKQAKDQQIFVAMSAKLDGQDQVAASKAVTDAAARQASADAAAVAASPAAFANPVVAEGNAASLAIDGVPAPGMPLPVPSPVRMSMEPAQAAPAAIEKKPGFWDKFKRRQPS